MHRQIERSRRQLADDGQSLYYLSQPGFPGGTTFLPAFELRFRHQRTRHIGVVGKQQVKFRTRRVGIVQRSIGQAFQPVGHIGKGAHDHNKRAGKPGNLATCPPHPFRPVKDRSAEFGYEQENNQQLTIGR